jgi:GT2 family glycosyltransferase
VPTPQPLASIVIPNWNGAHLLAPCLESLRHQTYRPIETIVADGASCDESQALVTGRFPDVRWLALSRNRGYAGNVNAGFRAARGAVLLVLNNDAAAEPDWVAASVETLRSDERLGSVAAKLLFGDRVTVNSAGDALTRSGRPVQLGANQPDGPEWQTARPLFGASGGAAAYRRAMLQDVGVLDEAFFAYLEDVDLAFRAQLRGWTCAFQPAAVAVHRERGSATGGGVLASYWNGRNGIRLLVKNVPSGLLRPMLGGMLRFQTRRAREAARAWRGKEARATLRGQLAGLLHLPDHLAARRSIQGRRRVDDAYVWGLLLPDE